MNTVSYEDRMPEDIERAVVNQYTDYEITQVVTVNNQELQGYKVSLKKDSSSKLYLEVSFEGEVLKEIRN